MLKDQDICHLLGGDEEAHQNYEYVEDRVTVFLATHLFRLILWEALYDAIRNPQGQVEVSSKNKQINAIRRASEIRLTQSVMNIFTLPKRGIVALPWDVEGDVKIQRSDIGDFAAPELQPLVLVLSTLVSVQPQNTYVTNGFQPLRENLLLNVMQKYPSRLAIPLSSEMSLNRSEVDSLKISQSAINKNLSRNPKSRHIELRSERSPRNSIVDPTERVLFLSFEKKS